MASPVLFHHPASLGHDTGMHPESAARIVAIEAELTARDWVGWQPQLSAQAPRQALQAIHPARHLNGIQELCAAGGGAIDGDTLVTEGSWAAALHAAGGAVEVVDLLLGAGVRAAASAHRPPGHHCESSRAMGFCLINNVAVAAQRARDEHGLERVMIVDWDVHHGNGTNDIFHATDGVLFVSLHESPLYPGTGPAGDVGTGPGEGFTTNLPMPSRSGDDAWVSVVEHVVRPLGQAYRPQLVLVSAGYDAHADDPLAGCRVSDAGFAAMAASVRTLADDVGAPLGVVLEGGYDVDALARSFAATLETVGGAPAPPELPVHPLAEDALARLGDGRGPLGAPAV